jgi:hypothetical protein
MPDVLLSGTNCQDAVRPDASHDDSRPARDGNRGGVNRERDRRSRPGAGQRRDGQPSNQAGCDQRSEDSHDPAAGMSLIIVCFMRPLGIVIVIDPRLSLSIYRRYGAEVAGPMPGGSNAVADYGRPNQN